MSGKDPIACKPDTLAQHYSAFRVSDRTLLTGHSHQAWPDVAFDGQKQAWLDAANLVDDKWSAAFAKAGEVKAFYAGLLGDRGTDHYVLAENTHELLVRFLSALPLGSRPRIVTTDGEFHSMRRQLSRLSEEAVEVVVVPTDPVHSLSERVAGKLNDATGSVMMSAVLYRNAHIVPGLSVVAERAHHLGIPLLVDAYHALNVMPFELAVQGLTGAFVVGGGYKYCQFGEGNCFMRIPPDCDMRPIVTGWYAEFGDLSQQSDTNKVGYPRGGDRFSGSTYDPVSHYRAAAVIDFFGSQGLRPLMLRQISQHQVGLIIDEFEKLDCDPAHLARDAIELENIAGFVAFRSNAAAALQRMLRCNGIWTDHRGAYLRLGPAPYVSDTQIQDAIAALGVAIRDHSSRD
ncbi:MAG: hypothetical protein WD002_10415 [Pseudomonadales bacterium]